MNSPYAHDTPNQDLLDKLIQANAQAAETRESVPYQPVVYAIPEDWRLAEKTLLEQAVRFQPELYRQIARLATTKQLQQLLDVQLDQLQQLTQQTVSQIDRTLQQDGSAREQSLSRTSDLLSESRREWQADTARLERTLRRTLIFTALASAALSALASLALHLCLA